MKKFKEDKENRTRGKKVEIDEELLKKIAAVHCSYEEMGWIVGCSVDTLNRRYRDTIEHERSKGFASVRKAQFKYALRGNAQLLIFLGKVYLNQKVEEESSNETINVIINDTHTKKVKKNGKDGKPKSTASKAKGKDEIDK